MRVLAGDIGGTKTRLAIFDAEANRLGDALVEATYASGDYASLEAILKEFTALGNTASEVACFGIAGPVRDNRSETTNLPWTVDARVLEGLFGWRRAALLNDLEANAWGIQALDEADLLTLNPGVPEARGNGCVIAAGTGLGEAGLYWDGLRHLPFACEGGHSDFAAGNALEAALRDWLSGRFGHVSWERVVSGPGLVNLYQFLLHHHRADIPEWLQRQMHEGDAAAAVSRAAMDERDTLCVEALDLFIRFYGAEAGNLALKMMATGGVYIGGGIAPKILNRLRRPDFLEAFCAKGRMTRLMQGMPVRVILNARTALYGPAVYANHFAL